nr:hypothetical protein B0A51_06960 [Rachicladosporium sp. CCFEE 5018]
MYQARTRGIHLRLVPFPQEHALDLVVLDVGVSEVISGASAGQQNGRRDGRGPTLDHVPDQPAIPLSQLAIDDFLRSELDTHLLNSLQSHLWLVTTRNGTNIDALHRQLVKRRAIFVTEDPALHLVWTTDRIYIKPLPICLTNHDFWAKYLPPSPEPKPYSTSKPGSDGATLRSIALGFLRSYSLLIRHPSDLRLAIDHSLLPSHITWLAWSLFTSHFQHIPDEDVAPRHHYGQIRLSRLNAATRLLRPFGLCERWIYEKPYWSTLPYVYDAAAPLLFFFAGISLVLSAMQVMSGTSTGSEQGVELYERVFWMFSIVVIVCSIIAMCLLVLIPMLWVANQVWWAYRHRHRRPKDREGGENGAR